MTQTAFTSATGAVINSTVPPALGIAASYLEMADRAGADVTQWLYDQLAWRNAKAIPVAATPKFPKAFPQGFNALSPQAKEIVQYMRKAGSISARDAVNDLGINSSALTRRITDIKRAGFKVERQSKTHGVTKKRYTRYFLKED